MSFFDVVSSIFMLALMVGVFVMLGITVKDFLEKWMKKRQLEQDIQELSLRFHNEKKEFEVKIACQTETIRTLTQSINLFIDDSEQGVAACEKNMQKIIDISDAIVEQFQEMMEKIDLVDQWVSQDKLSPELRQELLSTLHLDVEFKKQYENTVEQYREECRKRRFERYTRRKINEMSSYLDNEEEPEL